MQDVKQNWRIVIIAVRQFCHEVFHGFRLILLAVLRNSTFAMDKFHHQHGGAFLAIFTKLYFVYEIY